MQRRGFLIAFALSFLFFFVMLSLTSAAEARPHHHRHHVRHHHHIVVDASGNRPSDCYGIPWCGCWLRHHLNIADRNLNLARAWARVGKPASGPAVGVIVVWRHHVGIITGQAPDGGWIVKSGNDGHAVRERERSVRGAIAFRTA